MRLVLERCRVWQGMVGVWTVGSGADTGTTGHRIVVSRLSTVKALQCLLSRIVTNRSAVVNL